MLHRELKNRINCYLIHILSNIGLSKRSVCHLIRTIHTTGPFFTYIILLTTQYSYLAYGALSIVLFFLTSFIVYGGCILTKLELLLHDDGFTVIDPMLEFVNIDINYRSRYTISAIAGTLYTIVFLFTFYIRFLHTHLSITI